MADVLRKLGFTVVEGIDLDTRETEEVLRRFSRMLEKADVGLFYYAGHGMQVHGANYIVPVDAQLGTRIRPPLRGGGADSVLRLLEERPRTSLVFLDACRDNPFVRNLARSMGTRAVNVGSGLAQTQAGIGTLIAYATQPNNVAFDGIDSNNSPFTRALVDHIADARDRGAPDAQPGAQDRDRGDGRRTGAVGPLIADRRLLLRRSDLVAGWAQFPRTITGVAHTPRLSLRARSWASTSSGAAAGAARPLPLSSTTSARSLPSIWQRA